MDTPSGELKDCPSCGTQIAESAERCPICRSSLGRCVGCQAWIIEGTECWDCGKSTAVRARAARPPGKPAVPFAFDGSALGLVPILVLRLVLLVAVGVGIVYSVAGSPLDPVTWWLCEHGVQPLRLGAGVLWSLTGVLLLALWGTGALMRRYWLSHTLLYGKRVQVHFRWGSLILDLLITVVVLALTAGLGAPWIYARYRRSFFRGCGVQGLAGGKLDFQGTGEEVLVRFLLSIVLLPLGLATGGLLLGLLSWIWLRWEHSNLLVPDPNSQKHRLRFQGTWWAYLGRWALAWLLSLLTAGLLRPWARISEWCWVAEHTEVV